MQVNSFEEFRVWCGYSLKRFAGEVKISMPTLMRLRMGGKPQVRTWTAVLLGMNRIIDRTNHVRPKSQRLDQLRPTDVLALFSGVLDHRRRPKD
jgi:hypothetical protein